MKRKFKIKYENINSSMIWNKYAVNMNNAFMISFKKWARHNDLIMNDNCLIIPNNYPTLAINDNAILS